MIHQPVMVQEFLNFLPLSPNPLLLLDCTLGFGGHTLAFLEKYPDGSVLGMDRDSEILELTRAHLQDKAERVAIHHADFTELETLLKAAPKKPDVILMDLGISSYQLDQSNRGFSFQQDGPLDMRMDPTQSFTAQDILETYSQEQLAEVLWKYGDERFSRQIARKIIEVRKKHPLQTTQQLAQLICSVYRKRTKIHPATRTFQALRIEVNQELETLENGLDAAFHSLDSGGRLIVISFHSGEDRIVKNKFRFYQKELKKFELLTKKPRTPSLEEIHQNSRSRSALMRAGVKL
ncbi:MAG: 16S rRNA (cytosine(1402)-N(4))-methyltransferase RsmH [Planctomycetota bacterium]